MISPYYAAPKFGAKQIIYLLFLLDFALFRSSHVLSLANHIFIIYFHILISIPSSSWLVQDLRSENSPIGRVITLSVSARGTEFLFSFNELNTLCKHRWGILHLLCAIKIALWKSFTLPWAIKNYVYSKSLLRIISTLDFKLLFQLILTPLQREIFCTFSEPSWTIIDQTISVTTKLSLIRHKQMFSTSYAWTFRTTFRRDH